MTNERRVLRVFLSSTASDMTACREKVRGTILRLEQLPIGMETFTPLPTNPVADCLREAAAADVVIVMVAYRYGSPPSVELGGDGKRSVTWLEAQAAKDAGKDVFVFLVDPQATWEHFKESDLLNTEPEERHPEILARVRGLKEFKEYLNAHCTWALFTSADDLAAKVATLSKLVLSLAPDVGHVARVWQPHIRYPLQPAPHFQGRDRLRAELSDWACSRVTPDRVVSLVAVGGTGKTALAEQVLRGIGEHSQVGLFVWSFYENPRTEEFLRTACEYFTGETPTSAGGLLERLQFALTGDEPHLLVLDGLERVQEEGTLGRSRGELEDPQLRRLVRWLAAGQGTRTGALVTSRFPLVDLNDWKHTGHREERLEDLEPVAARAVLRGWGVLGDDVTLDALAAPLGYHALSVAVLGSYLGKMWGGDPTKAPTFDSGEMAAADPKAAKLTRILTHYAAKLPDAERDLLVRLSTFPRAVSLKILGFLIDAGGEIAGALAGCNQSRLAILLEQLRESGLVFQYLTPHGFLYSAHPFLRNHFYEMLGVVSSEDIHEVVRSRFVPTLGDRPNRRPADSENLDWYESWIEHTRLAGRRRDAIDIYRHSLGGFVHLGGVLGEFVRGMRIVSGFSSNGTPEGIGASRQLRRQWEIANDWGLYALLLGDLPNARRAFAVAATLSRPNAEGRIRSQLHQSYAELIAGHLSSARDTAASFLSAYRSIVGVSDFHSCLACAEFRLGNVAEGTRHLAAARQLRHPFYYLNEIVEIELKLILGERSSAKNMAFHYLSSLRGSQWSHNQASCQVLCGMSLIDEDLVLARAHCDAARTYGSRSGNVEVQLRCYHLAAEIARAERAYDLARSEAEAGIQLADTSGFGHFSIELRLALARAQLDAGDPKAALQRAREALDRSVHPECQYAWGEADGLHLCGVAHARLGEVELARQRLEAAVTKRESLTHPGLPETRAELDRLAR